MYFISLKEFGLGKVDCIEVLKTFFFFNDYEKVVPTACFYSDTLITYHGLQVVHSFAKCSKFYS